ncbi:GTPase HflX, partial [Mitsuokella sp.]|uniref:GTPase HflX n=1 Tax=Mitsuokella sp. TaxID=2049034 RepID=UPI003D7D1EBB
WPIEESMAELERLTDTAGAVIVGKFIQRREKPDAAFFLGRGKVSEIGMEVQNRDATLLILDDELTPSQQHNLEQMLGIKVIDRTALILDIFAQRAHSREGKLQVELAQLQYNLPRLGGQGLVLSRLGGGIGTRGPGETKLEVDRRRIYARIHDLEAQIDSVQKNRHLHRRRRKLSRIPLVALVGYTNAGKSTLLNKLTGSDVFAEDKLFATLDPTTRHLVLPEKQEILLTDTVGFIQKLPHTLVKAFRATLEEVQEADLLLHVVDCSNENYEQQIESVVEVLKELDAVDKPTLYVFNKSDCLTSKNQQLAMLRGREGICVSAKTGENLLELQELIERFFSEQQVKMNLLIPFAEGRVLTELHELNAVRETEYREDGTFVKVSLPASQKEKFAAYKVEE